MNRWLLLVYSVPAKPTSLRVYIWRKLKRLGAELVHNSVWMLPATERTSEQFRWMAAEIVEMGGRSTLCNATFENGGGDEEIVRRFSAAADREFRKIISALKKHNPDLAELSRRYQRALERDYFNSPTGKKTRRTLLARNGGGNS